MFMMVDNIRDMFKSSVKYGEYGSFERLHFLFI